MNILFILHFSHYLTLLSFQFTVEKSHQLNNQPVDVKKVILKQNNRQQQSMRGGRMNKGFGGGGGGFSKLNLKIY